MCKLQGKDISLFLVISLAFMVLSPKSVAVTFIDIWQYRIVGVTSVAAAELQEALAPFMGAARTIEDIDRAATAVQEIYQQQGFQTVAISVPDQDISSGVVTIVVDETRIRRVRVVGSNYFSLAAIKNQLPTAQEGAALNLQALQAEVQKLNRTTADLKVVPSVEASPEPHAVDVNLNVTDKLPLHGGVEITNYHSATTTPTRLAIDLRYSNLWQRYHELGLQYQTSPENTDEVQVSVVSYLAPLGTDTRLAAYYINSNSDISTVNDIRVFGEGEILGLRWVIPVVQKISNVQSFSLGFDYKNFEEDTFTINTLSTSAPIEYLTFSTSYSAQHNRSQGSDSVSAGFTWGLRGVVNDVDEFVAKRAAADASFIYFGASWQRTWYLPWGLEASWNLSGQIAESPLVSNEQFSAGGVNSVRGYYEAQIIGDSGLVANLELHALEWAPAWTWLTEVDLYAFVDGAWTTTKRPLAGEDSTDVISSVGVGAYQLLFDRLGFKVDAGVALEPLPGSVETETRGDTVVEVGRVGQIDRGDLRVRASLRYDF